MIAKSHPPSHSSFLLASNRLNLVNENKLVAFKVEFNPDGLRDELFAEMSIPFPTKLKQAVNKRKSDYLAGRIAAKFAFSEVGCDNWILENDKSGCPRFPKGVLGSISHSCRNAICLVAEDKVGIGVGVDIEHIIPSHSLKSISSQVAKHEEFDLLVHQNESFTMAEATTLIFSAKESLFKALFPSLRRYFGFEQASLCRLNSHTKTMTFQLTKMFKPLLGNSLYIDVFFDVIGDSILTYTIAISDSNVFQKC